MSPSEIGKEIAEHRARAAKERAQGGRARAGSNSDGYVRTTVHLATVLFLVGIGGHFRVRSPRLGLISVAGVILAFSCVLLILAPSPPL